MNTIAAAQQHRIELLKIIRDDTRVAYPPTDKDNGGDRLIFVLSVEIARLQRQEQSQPTNVHHLYGLTLGVKDTTSLVFDLLDNEPELMAGWYFGVRPRNSAQALANMVSRFSLEFTAAVAEFEFVNPGLKAQWDAEQAEAEEGINMRRTNNGEAQ